MITRNDNAYVLKWIRIKIYFEKMNIYVENSIRELLFVSIIFSHNF